ncbi:MAG: isoprenylcysteine carboxylmethyltransferase family protein [bacterium]|nr:isoprenylcysteine carboxylmethyltransferase family protein [bacterium]
MPGSAQSSPLAGVGQIYGAKLLRRREVTGGLYRISRHPQYVALAILAFGVLLIWPRFLVLVAFVTMLFLYALLARWEERLCLKKYGDGYRDYMQRVGWVLPTFLTWWIPPPPRWLGRPAAILGLFVPALGVAVGAGHALRGASLDHRISPPVSMPVHTLNRRSMVPDDVLCA